MKIKRLIPHLVFFVYALLLPFVVIAEATYYRNPYETEPLVIQHAVDIENFSYSYYILDEYFKPVCFDEKSPKRLEAVGKREKFYISMQEYLQASFVKLEWNYKKGNAGKYDDFLPDGKYSIHITEKNNKTGVESESIYNVVIDTKKPFIECDLTKDHIYKNEKEELFLLCDEHTKANSYLIFLDGRDVEPLYKETYSNGVEKPFPSIYFPYENYASLPLGKHSITIIAKDCALNTAEKTFYFSILNEIPHFSIFSNDDLIYKQDGSIKPYRFVGIGAKSKYWKARIIGQNGEELFVDERNEWDDLKPFEWDGISKLTQERVDEGSYTAIVSCKDIEGNLFSQQSQFCVQKEELRADLNNATLKEEIPNFGQEDEISEDDIFGELINKRRRILVEPIYFVGGDFDLLNEEKYFIENAASLKKAALAVMKLLKDGQTLVIAGHANYTTYPDDELMQKEDIILEKLSKNRAEIVKRVFMLYGLEKEKIKIEALGGSALLAPPNSDERWKNRRVELFVEDE